MVGEMTSASRQRNPPTEPKTARKNADVGIERTSLIEDKHGGKTRGTKPVSNARRYMKCINA